MTTPAALRELADRLMAEADRTITHKYMGGDKWVNAYVHMDSARTLMHEAATQLRTAASEGGEVSDSVVDAALFSQADEDTGMLIDFMGMGISERLPEARRIVRAALAALPRTPELAIAWQRNCNHVRDWRGPHWVECTKEEHESILRNGAWMDETGFNWPATTRALYLHPPTHPPEVARDAESYAPSDGEVLVTVSGLTGTGKSAVAGEIEILCKALGLEVEWKDSDGEKFLTHADWTQALELYKPRVTIIEQNIPRKP